MKDTVQCKLTTNVYVSEHNFKWLGVEVLVTLLKNIHGRTFLGVLHNKPIKVFSIFRFSRYSFQAALRRLGSFFQQKTC